MAVTKKLVNSSGENVLIRDMQRMVHMNCGTQSNGFNMTLVKNMQYPPDKGVFMVVGSQNGNLNIQVIAIRFDTSTTSTTSSYINLSGDRTVTRNGLTWHINANIYSCWDIYCPYGWDIEVAEGSLS